MPRTAAEVRDEPSPGDPGRWLLYLLPFVGVLTIVGLSLLYARFVTPHLRPRWLGSESLATTK